MAHGNVEHVSVGSIASSEAKPWSEASVQKRKDYLVLDSSLHVSASVYVCIGRMRMIFAAMMLN